MLTSGLAYNAVNIIIGVAGIVFLVLTLKSIPDKGTRGPFVTALILLVISCIILPVCLKIYKFGAAAYVGQVAGVAEGAYDFVKKFRYVAFVGMVFEAISVLLLVRTSKRLISLRETERSGEEE